VPPLLDRLDSEPSEITRANLVYLLTRMQKLGYYDVRTDERALSTVREAIESMNDEYWRETSETYLSDVQLSLGEKHPQ